MSQTGWMRTRLAAGAAAVSFGLAAGAVAVSLGPAAAPALGRAPHITVGMVPVCTQSALQAGLSRGFSTVSGGKVVRPFGCRDDWAYAAVNTKRFTLTSLFHDRDGKWVTVRRSPACRKKAVPARLFTPACESN